MNEYSFNLSSKSTVAWTSGYESINFQLEWKIPMHKLVINNQTATITLSRPPVNAINVEWIDAFNQILDELESNTNLSVLHIRSEQKVFCAGADLTLTRKACESEAGIEEMISTVRDLQRLYDRIESSPLVSIAEINGAAMGGGMELALACDLRVVAREARIGLPEARLGLLPGAGGTQRLTLLCGRAIASRLILSAELVDGSTAVELGIAQWSVPRSELKDFALNLANNIGSMSADAIRACKACILAATDLELNGFEEELSGTRNLMKTEETSQLVRAFLDKSA